MSQKASDNQYYKQHPSEWKRQAKALFFIDRLDIKEIAFIVHRARETVSRFLNDCEGYEAEMAMRKKQSAKNRKEYQRNWDRENRSSKTGDITGDSLKREHDQAVRILSRERFNDRE